MSTTDSLTLARRYAKALFDLSEQAGASTAVEKDLTALKAATAEKVFIAFLKNPLLSREQSEAAIKALLTKGKAHNLTAQFLARISANRRLAILPQIIDQYLTMLKTSRGEVEASITSATPLAQNQLDMLGKSLSSSLNQTVRISTAVDPSLIGGIVVTIGSQRLDYSVAGKLARLAHILKSSPALQTA